MRQHHIRHRAPNAGCGVNALSGLQVRHICRPDKMRKHRIRQTNSIVLRRLPRRHLGRFLFFIIQRRCRNWHHFTGFNPRT